MTNIQHSTGQIQGPTFEQSQSILDEFNRMAREAYLEKRIPYVNEQIQKAVDFDLLDAAQANQMGYTEKEMFLEVNGKVLEELF